jgi:hypothetical protein
MAFTYAWDVDFGNNPEDSESRRYGAQQIRKLKDALTERMQVDHEFGEEVIGTGTDDQTDTGYHKRVTLKNIAGGASAAAVAGYTELAYNSTDNSLTYYPQGGAKEVLVEKDLDQTLTNKTLTTPYITDPTITLPKINQQVVLYATSTELNQLTGVTVGGNTIGSDIPLVGGMFTPVAGGMIASNGAIENSFRVSSVIYNDTGDYTINLAVSATAVSKILVNVVCAASGYYDFARIDAIPSVSSVRIQVLRVTGSGPSIGDSPFHFLVYFIP